MKIFQLLEDNKNKNFKQWFADSKMVDADGEPMIFYHGTASVFSEFKLSKAKDSEGMKLGLGWGPNKFYFSSSPHGANSSAQFATTVGKGKNPNVIPVYLKITKPIPANEYNQRMQHLIASGHTREDAISMLDAQLKSKGVDGIVDEESSGYAVFDPKQIKSIFNSGGWGKKSAISEGEELNETHYEDFYSKQFVQFRDKYFKKRTDRQLFVNFNNHYDNTLDKSFSPNLDHVDPSGVYAYPLKYVIEHPMDVRYGATGKFLRVVRLKDCKILHIQGLSTSEMRTMTWKAKEVSFDDGLPYFKKHYKITHVPKIWFNIMQLSADGIKDLIAHYSNSKNKSQFSANSHMLSGEQQKQMFIDLGFDAIEDTARTANKAAINDWEPEQIIFLNKKSFEIIEVFEMGKTVKDTSGFITAPSSQYEEIVNRKIAAGVANAIGDSLMKSKGVTASRNGYKVFYTTAGRIIGVAEFETKDHSNRKLGEKPHKEHELVNSKGFTVFISSEKDKVEFSSSPKDRFDSIIQNVSILWHKAEVKDHKYKGIRSEAEENAQIKLHRENAIADKNFKKLMEYDKFDHVRTLISKVFGISLPEDEEIARVHAEAIGKFLYTIAENEKYVKVETDDFRYPIQKVFEDEDLVQSITRASKHVPLMVSYFIRLLSTRDDNPKVVEPEIIISNLQKVLEKVRTNPKILGHSTIYTSSWTGEYFPLSAIDDILKLHK